MAALDFTSDIQAQLLHNVESYFPNQGSNQHPLPLEEEFLTTGPQGKYLEIFIMWNHEGDPSLSPEKYKLH